MINPFVTDWKMAPIIIKSVMEKNTFVRTCLLLLKNKLCAGGLEKGGDVKKRADLLKMAYEMGLKIK